MAGHIKDIILIKLAQNNMTAYSLEKKMGLNRNTVLNIIRGNTKQPLAENLFKIAQGLNCSIEELLNLELTDKSSHALEVIDNLDMFRSCIDSIVQVFKEQNISPTFTQIIILSKEVYLYCLDNNNQVDLNFIRYLVKKL